MTKLLDQAIEAVGTLPPEEQDEIARFVLALMNRDEQDVIDPEHLEDVFASYEQAQRREFADEQQVESILRRLRA